MNKFQFEGFDDEELEGINDPDFLANAIQGLIKDATATGTNEANKEIIELIARLVYVTSWSTDRAKTFFGTDSGKEFLKIFPDAADHFLRKRETTQAIFFADLIKRVEKALPNLQQEVDIYKAEQGLDALTIQEAMNLTKDGSCILKQLLDRAENVKIANPDSLPWISLIAKKPQTHVLTNDPLTNALAGFLRRNGEMLPIVNQPPFNLIVNNKPEITAYTMVTIPENVSFSQKLDPEDLSVFFSVVSLLKAGNVIITPAMIYREQRGMTNGEYVEPRAVQDISRRLEKLTVTKIYLDYSDQIKRINHDRLHSKAKKPKMPILDDNGEVMAGLVIGSASYNDEGLMIGPPIGDYMLEMSTHPVRNGRGELGLGYYIKFTPPLLWLCEKTDQIITVNSSLMAIKETTRDGRIMSKTVRTTPKQQAIKDYLLRRIAVMKRDKKNQTKNQKQSNAIKFDTLYKKTGIDAADRKKAQAARSFTFKALDFWTAASYIDGYSVVKNGNKIHSVIIKI